MTLTTLSAPDVVGADHAVADFCQWAVNWINSATDLLTALAQQANIPSDAVQEGKSPPPVPEGSSILLFALLNHVREVVNRITGAEGNPQDAFVSFQNLNDGFKKFGAAEFFEEPLLYQGIAQIGNQSVAQRFLNNEVSNGIP